MHVVISFILFLVWGSVSVVIYLSVDANEYNNWLVHICVGTCFISVGVLFGIFGILINLKLYVSFRQFYNNNKKKLILSTIGLSIPIIIRGTLDVAASFKFFHDYVNAH